MLDVVYRCGVDGDPAFIERMCWQRLLYALVVNGATQVVELLYLGGSDVDGKKACTVRLWGRRPSPTASLSGRALSGRARKLPAATDS